LGVENLFRLQERLNATLASKDDFMNFYFFIIYMLLLIEYQKVISGLNSRTEKTIYSNLTSRQNYKIHFRCLANNFCHNINHCL